MKIYNKKRVSVIVEKAWKDRVIKLFEDSGASGFTIYKEIYGKGRHGVKGTPGSLNEVSGNVEIVSITGPEVAERILQGLETMIDKGSILIVHVTDVSVIRNDQFK